MMVSGTHYSFLLALYLISDLEKLHKYNQFQKTRKRNKYVTRKFETNRLFALYVLHNGGGHNRRTHGLPLTIHLLQTV